MDTRDLSPTLTCQVFCWRSRGWRGAAWRCHTAWPLGGQAPRSFGERHLGGGGRSQKHPPADSRLHVLKQTRGGGKRQEKNSLVRVGRDLCAAVLPAALGMCFPQAGHPAAQRPRSVAPCATRQRGGPTCLKAERALHWKMATWDHARSPSPTRCGPWPSQTQGRGCRTTDSVGRPGGAWWERASRRLWSKVK